MSTIELTGLIGSNPLGALASFGLLRVLSTGGAKARLSFVERDDWIAVLESDHASIEELAAFLTCWMRERSVNDFAWTNRKDLRVLPEEFRRALCGAIASDDVHLTSFLTSFAADGSVDKSKGLVKPTRFFMASGQQSFLKTFRALRDRLMDHDELWREALIGPWAYATEGSSIGWDPGTERSHALCHQAPSDDAPTCIAGAMWLAYEALPLFPTFSRHGREHTVGFISRDRESHWRWPLPTRFITRDALGALLASKEVAEGERLRLGIGAVYESTRYEFGQGYAVFRPARRVV